MTGCDEVHDLLAVRVLGAVDEAEAGRVDGHLGGCHHCRAVARALAEAAGRLVAEVQPSSELWARIVADVDQLDDRIGTSSGHRFERALIPRRFPVIPGWAIAAAYDSADGQLFMAGDFYDVNRLPGGGVAVVVGDVSSAGPEGAVVAVSIRNALKMALWLDPDPARAITAVERVLAEEFRDAWARMTIAVAPPGAGTVRVLSAGAPEPWLVRAATPARVPRNRSLGIASGGSWNVADVPVERGETLVVLSQGVKESWPLDDDHDEPESAFLGLLGAGQRSYELVLQVVDVARSAAVPKSDLVVVALTRDR